MSQTTLFNAADLGAWLRQDVTDEAASVVERVVWGWLRPVLKLTERPDVPSEELVAWAIELGAIAYTNPEGLAEYRLEEEWSHYSGERRDEILALAGSGGTAVQGAVAAPQGRFPAARRYPDPAERCW